MESDLAYRPPEHDEPPPAPPAGEREPRPTLVIAVCSVWVFEIVAGLVRAGRLYVFSGRFSAELTQVPLRQLIIDAVLLTAARGLWKMRKWGPLLFGIGIALLLFTFPSLLTTPEWLLLPAATIAVSVRYYRRMSW